MSDCTSAFAGVHLVTHSNLYLTTRLKVYGVEGLRIGDCRSFNFARDVVVCVVVAMRLVCIIVAVALSH